MDDQAKLLAAVDLLYGSILDEQELPRALRAIADVAKAKGVYHLTVDRATGLSQRNECVGIDPQSQIEYQQYFSALDVRIPPALDLPVGQTITEHSVLDESAFKSSEIFGDFLQPHDIPHIMAIWTEKTQNSLSAIALQRSAKQGRFLCEDAQRFAPLIPHLIRALRIRDLLQAARQTQSVYMDVVHRLPFGVVFLDDTSRPLEISATAQQLIRDGQGIRYKNGCIRAFHPDDDRRLQRAIAQTMTACANQTLPGDTVVVRRPSGKRSLSIAIIPVRSPQSFMSIMPSCMLAIFDPDYSTKPAASIVKKALQITDAEAVLACVLFTGVSLREAADQLDLSINTCKTQLKSIYAKTGCRSHVDLAKRLLMTGIANTFENSRL